MNITTIKIITKNLERMLLSLNDFLLFSLKKYNAPFRATNRNEKMKTKRARS